MSLFSRLVARRTPETRLAYALERLKEEDYPAATKELSALAQGGLAEAQFRLGQLYLDGMAIPRNLVEGARWIRRAAEAGWPEARYALASLYLAGLPPAVEHDQFALSDAGQFATGEPDYVKAAQWAERAATEGYADAQALYGYILSTAPEGVRNPREALVWYARAAQAGCVQGDLGLGLSGLDNPGSPEETAKAVGHLKKAAEAGIASALYMMGVLYEEGTHLPADPVKAAACYGQAAEQDIRPAQVRYGLALLEGRGVKREPVRGETWLRRAALAGDGEAAALLGDLHAGKGDLAPNYLEAANWYRFAIENGYAQATRSLENLPHGSSVETV